MRTRLEDAEKIKIKLSESNVFAKFGESEKSEDFDVSEFDLDTETLPRKFLHEIINARTKEIFNMVALELSKNNLIGKLPAGVVITGGGSLTVGVENMAKSIMKMPVRTGRPTGVTGLIDEIQGPEFSATVGAILYGASMAKSSTMLSFDKHQGKIGTGVSNLFDKLKSFLP